MHQEIIEGLRSKIERLETENEQLTAQLARANAVIRRAKDPNPVQRPSFKRVIELVKNACMTLLRVPGGWLLKLGHLARRFRTLKEIWEILIVDDWVLSELFPPDSAPYSGLPPRLRPRHSSIAPAFGGQAHPPPLDVPFS